jgi:hypothetical protein
MFVFMCRLSLAFGLLTSTDFYPKRKNATFFESEVSVMERINEWVTEKNIEPDTIRIETVIVPEYFKNDSTVYELQVASYAYGHLKYGSSLSKTSYNGKNSVENITVNFIEIFRVWWNDKNMSYHNGESYTEISRLIDDNSNIDDDIISGGNNIQYNIKIILFSLILFSVIHHLE